MGFSASHELHGLPVAAELDAAARITPQDIERAKAAARLYGTPLFNAMLDAEAEPARKPGRSQ